LRQQSRIVYLTASPGIILKRVANEEGQRPLLKAASRALNIRELLNLRKPFYERAADITINTSKLDINSIVEQIISRLKGDESFT